MQKKTIVCLMFIIAVISSWQCSTTKKLQNNAVLKFGATYFQYWVSGVAQGSSGVNLFIELKNRSIQLDSVFFRGKAAKFELKPSDSTLYIGRFINKSSDKPDLIMSNNMMEEYVNKAQKIQTHSEFKLEQNECIVSYKLNGKIYYHKIKDLVEKITTDIPMIPANRYQTKESFLINHLPPNNN